MKPGGDVKSWWCLCLCLCGLRVPAVNGGFSEADARGIASERRLASFLLVPLLIHKRVAASIVQVPKGLKLQLFVQHTCTIVLTLDCLRPFNPRPELAAMSKLSPALKQLINAAHSRPGPVPAPPRIQAVYQRIQEEATERKLGRPSWLGISTAATMTMNSPESMIALYNSTSASRPQNESVQIAEFMREIGLKCIGFNGV
jgi:hypothetical protein